MNQRRREAILHVLGLSGQVANEFCVGGSEMDSLDEEARAALRALGVTDAEIDDAEKGWVNRSEERPSSTRGGAVSDGSDEPTLKHSGECERCDGNRWVPTWTEEDGQGNHLCWCIEATETWELCEDCRRVNDALEAK